MIASCTAVWLRPADARLSAGWLGQCWANSFATSIAESSGIRGRLDLNETEPTRSPRNEFREPYTSMKTITRFFSRPIWCCVALVLLPNFLRGADETSWRPLFDGRSKEGWQ